MKKTSSVELPLEIEERIERVAREQNQEPDAALPRTHTREKETNRIMRFKRKAL